MKLCFSPVMLNLFVLCKELVLVPDAVATSPLESRGDVESEGDGLGICLLGLN